ncbi:hypothetical protein ACQCSX_05115 [Pseudarthrobacter sp. P1]|uniref:hypothetical protein n=1 Tax=Pseudarthrobacter sp. P1 TaxID=3418418 RepID=UPI003CF59583
MRALYLNPTVAALAAAVDGERRSADTEVPEPSAPAPQVLRVGRLGLVVCGFLQLLAAMAYLYITVLVPVAGDRWISQAPTLAFVLGRSAVVGVLAFAILAVLPIALKWILIGRWKREEFPLWGLRYVRFWLVKTLTVISPARLFVGTPVYPLYLWALGAKIGPGVSIFSTSIPACTDLLTIGAGTVVRKDASFACYRAYAGRIQTGTVSLGSHVVVGEHTVFDIDTAMGDGAQLGHASSLHRYQSVPAHQSWHGSPAQRAGAAYETPAPAECGTRKRLVFGLWAVFTRVVLLGGLALSLVNVVLGVLPSGDLAPDRLQFWAQMLPWHLSCWLASSWPASPFRSPCPGCWARSSRPALSIRSMDCATGCSGPSSA